MSLALCVHLEVNLAIAPLLPALAWSEPQTWQPWLHRWLVEQICPVRVAGRYELSVKLSNDSELAALNTRYRQVEAPTDVLSFSTLAEVAGMPAEVFAGEPLYLGDIAISVETAARQAAARQHMLADELVWLAAHGFLHLLGWDHPNREGLRAMLQWQERLLRSVECEPPNWQADLSAYPDENWVKANY